MNRLLDRVALVTGAATGVGAATAKLFLREGAAVVATDTEPIAWARPDAHFEARVHDVRLSGAWWELITAVVSRFGRLDILVNCAGAAAEPSVANDPEHVSLEHWRRMQTANVEGTVLGCQASIEVLRRSPHAAIVNLSSADAFIAVPGDPATGAADAAVWAYTRSLALHCARSGAPIRCNSVHLGGIRAPSNAIDEPGREGTRERTGDATGEPTGRATGEPIGMHTGEPTGRPAGAPTGSSTGAGADAAHLPMRRWGDPDEVAQAILFLASDDASYITGADLIVDGGLSAT